MGLVIIYGMAKAPNSKLRRFQDSLYILLVFLVAIPAFKALDSWLLPDYFPRVTQKDAGHLAYIIWWLGVLLQSIVMGLLVFFILTRRRTTQSELRWYQYSLRSLLVLVTLCALPCSWLGIKVQQAKRQHGAVRAIEELGGAVSYDGLMVTGESPGPGWLGKMLGKDFFATAGGVRLDKAEVTDAELESLRELSQLHWLSLEHTNVTDAGLVNLKGLTKLQMLVLSHTKITDAGLEHLRGLSKLETLSLEDTEVTDAGLVSIEGLTNLHFLDLNNTHVTDAGIKHLTGLTNLTLLLIKGPNVTDAAIQDLQKALPKLKVLHQK
jgi:hypothetical protein